MVKPFFSVRELADHGPRGNEFVSFWMFRS